MASFSDYSENGVLNYLFSGTAFTVSGRYLALFTSAGGLENNTVAQQAEVDTSKGYARVNIASSGGFTTSTAGSISNSADMTFPVATGDWGTITHTAVMDAATGGNVLAWGPLLASRTIYTGDNIKVPAGALIISLD